MPTTSTTGETKVVARSNENVFLFIPNLIGKKHLSSSFFRQEANENIFMKQAIRELFWRP